MARVRACMVRGVVAWDSNLGKCWRGGDLGLELGTGLEIGDALSTL